MDLGSRGSNTACLLRIESPRSRKKSEHNSYKGRDAHDFLRHGGNPRFAQAMLGTPEEIDFRLRQSSLYE